MSHSPSFPDDDVADDDDDLDDEERTGEQQEEIQNERRETLLSKDVMQITETCIIEKRRKRVSLPLVLSFALKFSSDALEMQWRFCLS